MIYLKLPPCYHNFALCPVSVNRLWTLGRAGGWSGIRRAQASNHFGACNSSVDLTCRPFILVAFPGHFTTSFYFLPWSGIFILCYTAIMAPTDELVEKMKSTVDALENRVAELENALKNSEGTSKTEQRMILIG